ncbi:hypothetical protein C6P42_000591, partial [Pichia californica]
MLKIQDLNPIFKAPTGLLPSNGTNSNNTGVPSNGGMNLGNNNGLSSLSGLNNIPLTPSFLNGNGNGNGNSNSQYNNFSQAQQQQSHLSTSEKLLTFTNYYKFCCLNNVNCYFYQFNNLNGNSSTSTSGSGTTNNTNNSSNSNNSNNTAGSTYDIIKYEQLIKNKLKNDYQINDIITWIAKRELCIFQLQIENPNENFDANIGFNQLKDAMSNIISENNLSLKLISASTFNSDKIFNNNLSNNNTAQNQLHKKSMNVIYLSFLRAVHRFILQKMTKSHSLFETSNQSLSINILPYSGQLITSSMIQKSVITVQNNSEFSTTSTTSTTKKKKILKKLVPYSILKISPSLNQKNELIVNMTSLKKIFYKLTDHINISCNGSIKILDEKSKFALYIAPSGIRCLIAGTSYLDSITNEPPENYEKLLNILKTFNDIDLNQKNSLINEKRQWIKIYPIGFNSSNSSPIIANYLENSNISSKKFIYWPLELCFIQFSSDHNLNISLNDNNEISQSNNFEINDPFQIIDEFIDVLEDVQIEKSKEELENKIEKQSNLQNQNDIKSSIKIEINDVNLDIEKQQDNKSEFKFPVSFNFKPELDSIDQQLKPIKDLNDTGLDNIDDIIKVGNDFDNLFNDKNGDLNLLNDSRNREDNDFQNELQNVFENQDSTNDKTKIENSNSLDSSISPDKKIDSNFEEDWGDLFGDSQDDEDKNIDSQVNS